MDTLISKHNILVLLELIEWRKAIMDNQEEGECVEAEIKDFETRLNIWIAEMKKEILEANSPPQPLPLLREVTGTGMFDDKENLDVINLSNVD